MGFFKNLFSKKKVGVLDQLTLRQLKEEHNMYFLLESDDDLDMTFGEWRELQKLKAPKTSMKPKYETIHMVIDDEFIESHAPFDVITPILWSIDHPEGVRDYKKVFASYTIPQRYVYAITQYSAEVDNGGHDQFFYNSAGIVWEDALEAFGIIGAQKNVDIIKESGVRMGGKPSKNRRKRQYFLEKYSPLFDDLDDLYYESEEAMTKKLHDYITNNAKDFYFSGDVTMLEIVASRYKNTK